MRRIALVVVALPAAVAACGGSGGGTAAKSGVAGASVRPVTVRESEYRLQLSPSKQLGPGTYRFTAQNVGRIPHALEIDGPGVSDLRTPGTIAPGSSKTLTVTLKKGSYEIYCPVPGHKAMGMDMHVKVGGGAAASSSGGAWG